jgi:hypothetical protein
MMRKQVTLWNRPWNTTSLAMLGPLMTAFVCALTNLLLTPIITTLPTLGPHPNEAKPTRKMLELGR